MGQRNPYVFSNRHQHTLKKSAYEYIAWINPWKAYKRGGIPIGLVEAYEKNYGYNPLKASRAFWWLEMVREVAAQWLIVMIPASFIMMIISANMPKLSREIGFELFFLGGVTAIALVVTLFTRGTFKVKKKQMNDFRIKASQFVSAFQQLFENEALTPSTARERLQIMVDEEMISVAASAVEHEIMGKDTTWLKQRLGEKSAAANMFDLGREWSFYYGWANQRVRPYELFTWEI
jgi:hypothetical protein